MNFKSNFINLALISGTMIATAGQAFAASDADTISMNSAVVETTSEAEQSLATDSVIESTSVSLEDGRYRVKPGLYCDYLVTFAQEKIYFQLTGRPGNGCRHEGQLLIVVRQPDGTYMHESTGWTVEILNSRSVLFVDNQIIVRKISDY